MTYNTSNATRIPNQLPRYQFSRENMGSSRPCMGPPLQPPKSSKRKSIPTYSPYLLIIPCNGDRSIRSATYAGYISSLKVYTHTQMHSLFPYPLDGWCPDTTGGDLAQDQWLILLEPVRTASVAIYILMV